MNELFTRTNTVGVQKFTDLLAARYDINEEYASKIG